MLKNDYPILFDGEQIFTPETWEESSNVVENVNTSEAGTDIIVVVRYDKLSVSASFNCSSAWAAKFATYRDKTNISVSLYDIKSGGYKKRKMRIRNFKSNPQKDSEKLHETEGLYVVSFDLEEF